MCHNHQTIHLNHSNTLHTESEQRKEEAEVTFLIIWLTLFVRHQKSFLTAEHGILFIVNVCCTSSLLKMLYVSMKLWFQTQNVFFVVFAKVHSFKFYIMHKSIFLKKKDLYKAQNAYNASRYRGKKVEEERERLGGEGNWGCGEAEKKRRGQRSKRLMYCSVPLCPPQTPVSRHFCNTTAHGSSRTDRKRCSYIHIKLSMWGCRGRRLQLLQQVHRISFVCL